MPALRLPSALLAIAALLALVPACSHDHQSQTRVFHGAMRDDVKTMDPASAYDLISLDIVPTIYETLYQYDVTAADYRLQPLLATGMPVWSADRLTVTVPIRHGVYFQDDPCFKNTGGKGRELKAADFVYGIKRLALPSLHSEGWWTIDKRVAGINAFHDRLYAAAKADIPALFDQPVEGLEAVDDYTLRIRLLRPYPLLTFILAMNFTSPIAREAAEAYADDRGFLPDHPVGTGPFRLKSWERNHKIVLARNPTFHEELFQGERLPFLDELVMDIIKEDQPAWLNFLKGNIESLPIPKDNYDSIVNDKKELAPELRAKGIKLVIEPASRISYLSFNMRDPVLGGSKLLRQALSSSLDRRKWIDIFTNGRGAVMVNSVPPGIRDRPKTDRIKYDYDPARAKELLKKAGYPDGKGLPPLNLDMRGADSVSRQLGEFLAGQFAASGVKINVIYNTFPAFLSKLREGRGQIYLGGWGLDYPDAENIFQLVYSANSGPGSNESNFNHPEMNRLYERMAAMDPGPARAKLVQRMDDILQEECPWAFGFYNTSYHLIHDRLQNFRAAGIITNRLKYYRLVNPAH